MTAINVFSRPEALYVLTDAMGALSDGNFAFLKQKQAPVPNFSAVVATRGPVRLTEMMAGGLTASLCDDFDDLASELLKVTKTVVAEGYRRQMFGNFAFQVVLAGWPPSAEGGTVRVVQGITGDAARSVMNETAHVISPCNAAFSQDLRVQGFDPFAETFDPRRDGLWLMEKQRLLPGSGVGGFCQITTVARGSIATSVLKSWPLSREVN